MQHLHRRGVFRHSDPDLFEWVREQEVRRASPVARKIASRFGLSIHHAATIANLAGLGMEPTR
jgi:hypothetical protein